MKKATQKEINEQVLKALQEFDEANQCLVDPFRLRTCQAYVYSSKDYFALESYNTFVAIYDKRTHILYDFLRYIYGYTATSAQHISKFKCDLGCKECYVYKPV